jgi:segregation and condensation protein A
MNSETLVGALDLDLDAFEGPFDLLLALVLREEVALSEVDLAEIVVAFVSRLAGSERLDLDACGEFLVLIAALLELKVRSLFADGDDDIAELEPEEAAQELARRLAVYRRIKDAAGWLEERLAESGDRFFRLGPAPISPLANPVGPYPQRPEKLSRAIRALATEPPRLSTAHMGLRFPPVEQFVERWRSLLADRCKLDFDQEVSGLSRVEVAVAFLALLELRKQREVELSQAAPFAPIRILRAVAEERSTQSTGRFA